MLEQSLFQDSEETIPSAEINDRYLIKSVSKKTDILYIGTNYFFETDVMKTKLIFIGMKPKANIQFTILEQFLKFKACKSGEIDAIGIEVVQQIKLAGCPTKGYFTTKSGKNASLTVLLSKMLIISSCKFISNWSLPIRDHSYITSSHFWDFWTPLPPTSACF